MPFITDQFCLQNKVQMLKSPHTTKTIFGDYKSELHFY